MVYDTPEKLPFFSLGQTGELEKDVIYIRRGTKSEKATYEQSGVMSRGDFKDF